MFLELGFCGGEIVVENVHCRGEGGGETVEFGERRVGERGCGSVTGGGDAVGV